MHHKTYHVENMYEYYVEPAKYYALMAYRLLRDNAALVKKVIAENPPVMTAAQYVNLLDSMQRVDKMEMLPVPKQFT